ncbi:MAG: hypothetical protein ACREAU_05095 [Nitrosopumilaceae archaeon]
MGEHSVPTSPEDIRKLKAIITEMTHSMQRISDERESLKELVDAASKEYGIKKKQINELAKVAFNANYADVRAAHDDFEYLWQAVIEGKKPTDVVSVEEEDA